jgi:putative hemolysin
MLAQGQQRTMHLAGMSTPAGPTGHRMERPCSTEVIMLRKATFTLFVLLTTLGLAACAGPAARATVTPQSSLPNPASVYCTENGGTVEMRQDSVGGQYGVCAFPDTSECDEWAYFRGDCKPGDSLQPATSTPADGASVANPASAYCEKNGGTVEFRQDGSGGVKGMCVFPDKTECDEWAYYRDECKPGTPAP